MDIPISVVNRTRGKLPVVDFNGLKRTVLGNSYDLSLALLTPKEARAVAIKMHHSGGPPNILSYSLSKYSGEILLCPSVARSQAKQYAATYQDFLSYLFIHGLLHLKGHLHGATMERSERGLLERFGLSVDF